MEPDVWLPVVPPDKQRVITKLVFELVDKLGLLSMRIHRSVEAQLSVDRQGVVGSEGWFEDCQKTKVRIKFLENVSPRGELGLGH